MEQQFLRPNEERRLNVKLLSELDNVVTRAREALAPQGKPAAYVHILGLAETALKLRECIHDISSTTAHCASASMGAK